jgi:hypothetical protein
MMPAIRDETRDEMMKRVALFKRLGSNCLMTTFPNANMNQST